MGSRPTSAVATIWLLASPGCEAPAPPPGIGQGADTVEVRPERDTGTIPAVDSLPGLVLGLGTEHDPPFYRVDIARILPDASVVVADAGALRVHRYGPDGTRRWTIGGPGVGPGRFRAIAGVVPLDPARLLVFDPALRRFTVLGMEMWGDRRGSIAIPFGRRTLTVVQGGHVFVGDSQSGRIDIWGGNRELQRSMELQDPPPAIEADDVRRWIEDRTRGIANASQRRARSEWLEQVPLPERYPFLGDLRVDHAGRIWLKGARRPGEEGPPIWAILDPSGAVVARVSIPGALRVQEILSSLV